MGVDRRIVVKNARVGLHLHQVSEAALVLLGRGVHTHFGLVLRTPAELVNRLEVTLA